MNDLYSYLNQLHYFVQKQEQRIKKLEQTVEILRKEMVIVKERPPVRIERMEYKFDQLKVENLEGTLNIGLNPSDLQDIDDFSINNGMGNAPNTGGNPNVGTANQNGTANNNSTGIPIPYSPKQHLSRVMELEDSILAYLENELPEVFKGTLSKLNTTVDESYLNFIRDDIKKQIPNRIEYYLKEFSNEGREYTSPESNEQIIELLKKEIQNGVYAFISHLPDNVKGMKQE
ncbi:spore germination protein GerPC [Bacillus sp. 31A1R]|uniref:Spore germination protein GerPC n=1 Tax=Robertmurraya mangrovi TaxID=3098077 RepID=A0ABU5ISZ3_9BACI|nr:spore germination protein GerPC [Bacillus sp. 31A1R]MDZ5470273.1 spore germination protein GerPC [Bacillus sp. 31A1R]